MILIKDFLIKIKIFILIFLISLIYSCHDNYKECSDLTYGTEYIKITGVSKSDKNYFKYFCKTTEVFGIKIYATNKVDNEKMLHAASILAEYLDNDEDGLDDDGWPTENADYMATQRWNNILGEIVYGLKCAEYIKEDTYGMINTVPILTKPKYKDMNRSIERSFSLMGEHLFDLWD